MLSALGNNRQDNMMDLITLMANPEAFKARTEELRALEARANERIALAGEADEIVRIREDAERLQAEAHAAVAKANDDAQKVVAASKIVESEAKVNAELIIANAEAKARDIIHAAENTDAQLRVAGKTWYDETIAAAQAEAAKVALERDGLADREGELRRLIEDHQRDREILQRERNYFLQDEANYKENLARFNERVERINAAWEEFIAKGG